MGIGGWLTNYKRFNVLPNEWRLRITEGDMEHFNSYITSWDVQNIKNMGLDHVRLCFDQIVLEYEPYKYRESIFNLIKKFVDDCVENKLTVVLNLHKAIGNYCDIEEEISLFDSEELQDRFISLWKEFAIRFKNYNNVMFELLNEVRDVDPQLWNSLAERTINEIRKYNPSRIIIVGGTNWNVASSLKYLKVFDDENVIYTFHMYAPFEFTHQRGVLQPGPLYYNRVMHYPSDDIERYRNYYKLVHNKHDVYKDLKRMDIQFIRKELEPARQFKMKYPDRILWCGEFGTIRHCDITSRENWMRDVIKVLIEWDIPYCVWNYLSTPNDGNRFSLVDDDTRQILSQNLLEIINGRIDT